MVQESVASVALPYLEVTFTFLLTNLSKGSGKALEKLKRLFIETLALLTYITRLWPILLLIILGIFVAALRLLFLSSQKVEPVRPLLTLPPPHQPPTEKDLQSAAYTIVQCRITQILSAKFPEARWVWENPRAMEDILAGKKD